MNSSKTVPVDRSTFTKAERQYIQGIVHNFSLQRWTDQDIVDYLREEKKINIGRSTVTKIKNQVEKQAGKWYVELRGSTYKSVAFYKERLDSLLSYQKKLNEIMDVSEIPETKVRAIAELHRIEMSIRTIFMEFPHGEFKIEPEQEPIRCDCRSMSMDTFTHSKCRYCKQVWCPLTLKQDWCPNPECVQGIKGCKFEPGDDHYKWVECSNCEMWFKTPDILAVHNCYIKMNPKAFESEVPCILGEYSGPIEEQSHSKPKPEIITTIEEQTETEEHEEEKEEPKGSPWTYAEAARAAARVNKGKSRYVSQE